ncbi:hypothetical protein [Cochleicola gelatinilyticus]|uniref:PNPLA domain-containing protein n=1 Tax=Cochleicola gelatinilyticus TaxID=1763537 RepID=A0A167HNQ2_9FLAO|nr:hypothetical protein [Cochleicola gelatinilyticus]OAB78803.1 hypothetical protein ULVI_09490 [Cochleicola gelatinilyticus]
MKPNTKNKSWIESSIDALHHFVRSFKNFFKSSFLSLLVITIILLLLTQMDQAFTMMVDLIEGGWFSLLLAFFFINALAIALSHYPIYTYYASGLNNSGDYTEWHEKNPIRFWPFKRYPIFVFTAKKDTTYVPDNWANYLRYFIGLLIHGVWIHFIISSFKPNLIFENFPFAIVKGIIYMFLVIPFVLYIYIKEKEVRLKRVKDKQNKPIPEQVQQENIKKLRALYKRLGIYYFIIALIMILLLIVTIFIGNFSPGGFFLIILTSYAFIFNYLFFRLLRTKLTLVKSMFTSAVALPVNLFLGIFSGMQKSENYMLLFYFNFLIAFVFLLFSTLSSINGGHLVNGIPILLAFFYFYYFIIASLGKYFFVARKNNLQKTKRYKLFLAGTAIAVVLIFITNFSNVEVTTHELDLVENTKSEITEQVFLDSLKAKQDNTLFFIASHGGGLKANVWTLNVLNKLQKSTEGKLLNQTIALSGASGGSLGLALYTGLYKEDGLDFDKIQKKIDVLSRQNYTSLDLSLTFGLDTYRKIWPLSQRIGLKDRPYYAMIKYQNNIQNTPHEKLSEVSFRDYWKSAFTKHGYFPSLIMNTAGTKGNRGILWSVKQENFNDIFPYAENLADLENNKTLPYYQAVSTTNRFPVFSPAAKIKGYGHYIDAGAIDNSGLLGCLDIQNYLQTNRKILRDKQIAYIEIINSKTLYINYLVELFKTENNFDNIPKNENETDNIVVDLQTGLNLDKIPGYLSDYINNWEESQGGNIRYFKIFMPHKVSMDDVESFFGGKITDAEKATLLKGFLAEKNTVILNLTEKPEKSFFDPWEFYEPTLSRHLSKSSLNYVHAILNHPLLRDQFKEIETLVNTQVIEENKNPETAF